MWGEWVTEYLQELELINGRYITQKHTLAWLTTDKICKPAQDLATSIGEIFLSNCFMLLHPWRGSYESCHFSELTRNFRYS